MRQLRLLLIMIVVMSMIVPFNSSPVSAIGQPFEEGDIFTGVWLNQNGNSEIMHRRADTSLAGTLRVDENVPAYLGEATGMAFDQDGNLYVPGFGSRYIVKFNTNGDTVDYVRDISAPVAVVFDASNHLYASFLTDGTVQKYDTDLNLLDTFTLFAPSDDEGFHPVYHLDFASDQCTLFYTSGDNIVRRFNVCTNQQLPDFSTLPDQVDGVRVLYDGSVLVASTTYIYRLDWHGTVFQLYSASGIDYWNNIALSPDSISFWASGDASVYKFSIESGDQLTSFSIGNEPMWVESLAIFSESCPFIQDCDRDGLSNYHETTITHTDPHNADTDGDGLLDPWEVDPDPDGDGTRIPGAGFNLDGDPEIEVIRDHVFGPYTDENQPQDFEAYKDGRIPSPFPQFVQPPDPLHKDIYFELDWQDCTLGACPDRYLPANVDKTHHAPSLAGINKAKAAFDQAPLDNPDGDQGIRLHMLVDEALVHNPNCDRNTSSVRNIYFGTAWQRQNSEDILKAKEQVFRYIWSGHSTERDDTDSCALPNLLEFVLGPLPFYDHSPFGEANTGGSDILVSLGPLWICPSFNVTWGMPTCFKNPAQPGTFPEDLPWGPGIFPAAVYTDDVQKNMARLFRLPYHLTVMEDGTTEQESIARLWGRTLMHLIGHSLGLEGDQVVLNDPRVYDAAGNFNGTEPQLYTSWENLKLAPDPDNPGTPQLAREAYPPHQSGTLVASNNPAPSIANAPTNGPFYQNLDIDGDGVVDGIDNCLMGIKNPDQADLDGDGWGDACDYDIDGDGQFNAVGANTPADLDALPLDTNNDGTDNTASADDDGDGISDSLDNCTFAPNTDQANPDGDTFGNACDDDDDNDAFTDAVESLAGSNPLSSASKPEYIGRGASCTDNLDNDGDGQTDGGDAGCIDADADSMANADDNCPNIANSGWPDRDNDGIGDACDPTPLPPNTAPTAAITGTYTVDEGSSITVAATGVDAESSSLNFLWDLNDDDTFGTIGQSVTLDTGALAIDGPSAHPINVKVLDEWDLAATATTNVTVRNLAPVVGSITAAKNPIMATSLLMTSANFTDAGVRDTHTAIWDWGDGTTSEGYVDAMQGAGSVNGSHIYTTPGQYTVKLTVKDDDQASTQVLLQNVVVEPAPIVEYSTTALSVRENVSTVLVTVLLRSPSSETTQVDYTTSNGTATAGSDYYTASGTLTFAPGETLKTFTVQIENDTADEANEIINLALSDPQHATLGPISTATITIEDDDVVPSVAFDLSKITVHENVGTVNVEVELKSISNNPITVDYTTSDGTANAGSDYTATSGTLTFAPGQSRQSFTVPIVEDTLGEPNETINLTLSNPTNATLGTISSSIITINANDTLSFAGNVSVAEYAGLATMTIRLNAPSSSTVTVDYITSNGTATAGSDYTATSGTLTFAPGETIKTFTVPIIDDVLGENNETVTLSLSNPTNATLSATPTATLTINGNDTLSFNGNVSVQENAGTATITVRLNGASNLPVTVDYATNNGTATAGSDYTATSGTLTFAPGETSKTFTVAVLDDALGEASETVLLTLSNPTNAALSATPTATLTINANDTLSFNGNVSVHENAGTATITVKLSGPGSQPVTIDYAINGGTATAGSDYTAASGTLTFAPGETSKTFTVAILEDALGESSETITLALSNPSNAVLGSPSTATLTINANDTLTFNGNVSIHENAGSATITVKLSGPAGQPVTVDYTTSDGTATAGSDYTATSGTLTFAPGETSKTFTVAVLDDALGEASETVLLTLSNPTNAALSATPTATLTINANDALTFGASTYRVNESTASATITVKLSGPASQPVTIDYATGDGTATAGSDYTTATGSFTFAPGETSKTFVVPFINDTLDEPNETVEIQLSNPGNAVLGSPATATLTIVDND